MYKKYTQESYWPHRRIPLILRVMKVTTLIIFAAIMQVSASTFAQKITLRQSNVSLKQLFNVIRQQTGYDVLYQTNEFDATQTLNANFKDTPLKDVLDKSLDNRHVQYTIEENTIVIKPKEENLFDRAKAFLAQVTVSGKVQDGTGQPLPGVTVKIKDTNLATVTDSKGSFSITAPDDKTIVVFSFIGFETQELAAKDIPNGSVITLKASQTNLQEVVVSKGYYSVKQELNTGSVTRIGSDIIE